jgi:hypothetical protein
MAQEATSAAGYWGRGECAGGAGREWRTRQEWGILHGDCMQDGMAKDSLSLGRWLSDKHGGSDHTSIVHGRLLASSLFFNHFSKLSSTPPSYKKRLFMVVKKKRLFSFRILLKKCSFSL